MILSIILVFHLICGGIIEFSAAPIDTTSFGNSFKAIVEDKCTAIAVGRKATVDQSTMTTHTADCSDCDWRVNIVPARDWPEGSMRPIYILTSQYPKQVREDRGYTWSAQNLENLPQRNEWKNSQVEILGYIPQFSHTYQIFEGLYGIMNEHSVAIGESTCAAKLFAAPIGSNGGKALLDVAELSQIGLERAKTARECIEIMGNLASTYGYYSADWDTSKYGPSHAMGEGGEALTIIDPTEAWMFHIIPDDTGTSAVWVAQRVPDNHISAVANQFVIREIKFDRPDEFLYSSNIIEVAKRNNWYKDSDGAFNFLKVYVPERYHPNYSNMRVWRVFSMANPTLNLPMFTNSMADDYPFSVPVLESNLLSAEDIMKMNRDHYEGTSFDLTKGLASGPYGDPNRYDIGPTQNLTVWDAMEGEFPRAISLFRTSYSFVAVARLNVPKQLGMVWFSQYAPDISSYIPIYVHATELPLSWIRGSMHRFDTSSAWWNFCVAGNWVARYYNFAIKSVRELQSQLFNKANAEINILEKEVSSLIETSLENENIVINKLTSFTLYQGDYVSLQWKDFFTFLVTTYRDGYVVTDLEQPSVSMQRMFYPKWFLDAVGYFNIHGNDSPNAILFQNNPNNDYFTVFIFATVLIPSLLVGAIGYYLGKKSCSRNGYVELSEDLSMNASINYSSIEITNRL